MKKLLTLLCIATLSFGCSKNNNGTPNNTQPAKLVIQGPAEVVIERNYDTVETEFTITSSDGSKMDVKSVSCTSPDVNNFLIDFTPAAGTTELKVKMKIISLGLTQVTTLTNIKVSVMGGNDVGESFVFNLKVVPVSHCEFRFTGSYNFYNTDFPGLTFFSQIIKTGNNALNITNFNNTGRSVSATINCESEVLTIPYQPYGSSYIQGSGVLWGGLDINYTEITGSITKQGKVIGQKL